MNIETILNKIKDFLQEPFSKDTSGHDFFHLERVVKQAKYIQEKEGGDLFLIEISAWLHDTFDDKLVDNIELEKQKVYDLLLKLGILEAKINTIFTIIDEVSFRKNKDKTPSTIEAKIVQDADRLDAIGAIGIARTFAYGGHKNRELYNPNHQEHTIAHFDDKLLKLKDLMNTETAYNLALERHQYMLEFVNTFKNEWN